MKRLNFCFKGNRNYVHGPDIVNELLKNNSNKEIIKVDIKFNGISKFGLDLVEGSFNSNAKVNISWQEFGITKDYQLIDNGEPIECRYEYNEKLIIDHTLLDKESKNIKLISNTGYTIYQNIVAMNKFLLESLYEDVKGKWLFTRFELLSIIKSDVLIELRLIKNFNNRLTKSDILSDGKILGSIYFSLIKGDV